MLPLKVLYGKVISKKTVYEYYFSKTYYKNFAPEIKEILLNFGPTVLSNAYMSHGFLEIAGKEEISVEQQVILQRFAKVFDQTYTRFLDIQKAEAQAREAQIELSLERVRARSMAMHQSEELSEVVALLFEEIKPFGFATSGCELILIDEKNDQLQFWLSSPVKNRILECYNIPRSIHPFFSKAMECLEKSSTTPDPYPGRQRKEGL